MTRQELEVEVLAETVGSLREALDEANARLVASERRRVNAEELLKEALTKLDLVRRAIR